MHGNHRSCIQIIEGNLGFLNLPLQMKLWPFNEFIETGSEDGRLREESWAVVFDVLLSFLIFVYTSTFKFKDTELEKG